MLPEGFVSRVHEYYFTAFQFRAEMLRALREFYNNPELGRGSTLETPEGSEGLFTEWFLFDFTLRNGRTPLEDFIAANPLGLTEPELEAYRNLLDNVYGLFEVEKVELGQGLTLRDWHSGKKWQVRERAATFNVLKGSLFFGRLGKVGDHHELIGSDPVSLPGALKAMKRYLRDLPAKLTPKEAYEMLQRF